MEEEGSATKSITTFSSSLGEEDSPSLPPALSSSSSIKRWKDAAACLRLFLRPLEGLADWKPALFEVARRDPRLGSFHQQSKLTHLKTPCQKK
ncbi:UNVERIFIED_CONTAM: hypothetical protein Sradi_3247600 [Sesamum radiatum]|uniref:Uncharacterized protein n=1 Tax=Sesamum radiatum TaxID=300843 RepID=A0AAW2R0E7_SESRA